MKKIIKRILSRSLLDAYIEFKQFQAWRGRGYLDNSPQVVKKNIFQKFGVEQAQWVETGTYVGLTTNYLAGNYSYVFSIEPDLLLYNNAVRRFHGRNVELFNGVSEQVLPELLPKLKGDVNFWLDGHYSAGVTFQGETDCPVEGELAAISENLNNFSRVSILIDDVRCFLPNSIEHTDYPSIDYLVNWARNHNFNWRIEHDIFVMQNHNMRPMHNSRISHMP